MTRAILSALLSHWRRHPLQLGTLLIGLALATALWAGVQAINAEARASYARASGALGQAPMPEIEGDLTVATYAALRRAGWNVTPVIEGEVGDLTLIGVDPVTSPPASGLPTVRGEDALALLTGEGLIFAAPETIPRLPPGLPPARVSPNAGPGEVLTDIRIAARILERGGRIDRIRVLLEQPPGRPALSEVDPALRLAPPRREADIASLTDSFHLNLTAFGLLSFAVGLFIVHAAVGLAFEQRRTTVRTLRALGAPGGRIVAILLAELLAIALVAGLLGVALGYAVAAALLPGVAATLGGLYGADVAGSLSLRPGWVAAGLAMATAGALLAAAGALWRIARLPVLAAAQPRAWARASIAGMRLQAAAGLALLAVSAVTPFVLSGLVAGFTMLGALLLGAALLLPATLTLALAALQRPVRGVLPEWFLADTRQQLPQLSLALMALLLALAANIGVETMVSSFRLTFTGWLDQRLASEIYVTAEDEAQAADLLAFLEPRTDAILPIFSVEAAPGGMPGDVFGVADHPTYTENWPLLAQAPDAWDRLAAGEGALINEQLARREGLAPGDVVTLDAGWELPVLAVYSDYGNPRGQALVGDVVLAGRYPDVPILRFGLRVPDAEAPALIEAITGEFGLSRESLIDQASIKALSLSIFEQTFVVTGALGVLTLGVAGFAMLASLLTLASMRLPQLAPVWAMGITRKRLSRFELARSAMLGAATAVLALPVGLALAWVLLAVVNVEAFGWRLPMHLFPLDYARLGVLAVVAAVLAALIPVRRLATMPPRALIQVFTHER